MLPQHDTDRPAFPGNPGFFHGGKEQVLFFPMVAFVGEDRDELQHLREVFRAYVLP